MKRPPLVDKGDKSSTIHAGIFHEAKHVKKSRMSKSYISDFINSGLNKVTKPDYVKRKPARHYDPMTDKFSRSIYESCRKIYHLE